MKIKLVVEVLCILWLAACTNRSTIIQSYIPLAITQTEPLELSKTTPAEQTKTLPVQEGVLLTPTLRSVKTELACKAVSMDSGHILFLKKGRADISTGRNNLYIMDGNGCFPTLVMERVDSSPAWSKDGEQIAIVCDENKYVCILDAQTILDSCFGPEKSDSTTCVPTILEKYPLPEWAGKVYYISWSPDDSMIAIDGYDVTENTADEYFLSTLDLANGGKWILLKTRAYEFESDWSPVENKLAYSSEIIDLDTDHVVNNFPGYNPQWFPTGDQIAFYRDIVNDENRYTIEPTGIALFNIKDNTWEWVYEPAPWNSYDHFMGNIFLGSQDNFRQMSWDPSGRYIAFVSPYRNGYDDEIFRLDTLTGEIVVLTAGYVPSKGGGSSFAPVWGP